MSDYDTIRDALEYGFGRAQLYDIGLTGDLALIETVAQEEEAIAALDALLAELEAAREALKEIANAFDDDDAGYRAKHLARTALAAGRRR